MIDGNIFKKELVDTFERCHRQETELYFSKAENSEVFTIPSKDKSRRFVRHTVICPYYKSSENKPSCIRCEGINSTIIKITFESREIRKDHEKHYCCSNYRSCPYASLHKQK